MDVPSPAPGRKSITAGKALKNQPARLQLSDIAAAKDAAMKCLRVACHLPVKVNAICRDILETGGKGLGIKVEVIDRRLEDAWQLYEQTEPFFTADLLDHIVISSASLPDDLIVGEESMATAHEAARCLLFNVAQQLGESWEEEHHDEQLRNTVEACTKLVKTYSMGGNLESRLESRILKEYALAVKELRATPQSLPSERAESFKLEFYGPAPDDTSSDWRRWSARKVREEQKAGRLSEQQAAEIRELEDSAAAKAQASEIAFRERIKSMAAQLGIPNYDGDNIRHRARLEATVSRLTGMKFEPRQLHESLLLPEWFGYVEAAIAALNASNVPTTGDWVTITDASVAAALDKGVLSRAVDHGEVQGNGQRGTARRVSLQSAKDFAARKRSSDPSESEIAAQRAQIRAKRSPGK